MTLPFLFIEVCFDLFVAAAAAATSLTVQLLH